MCARACVRARSCSCVRARLRTERRGQRLKMGAGKGRGWDPVRVAAAGYYHCLAPSPKPNHCGSLLPLPRVRVTAAVKRATSPVGGGGDYPSGWDHPPPQAVDGWGMLLLTNGRGREKGEESGRREGGRGGNGGKGGRVAQLGSTRMAHRRLRRLS